MTILVNIRHVRDSCSHFLISWNRILFILFLSLTFICLVDSRSFAPNKCEHIPRDHRLVQRAGDGGYEIQIFLLPPGQDRLRGSGNHGVFWPIAFNKPAMNNSSEKKCKNLTEYLPGRDYQILLTPKTESMVANAFQLEAVYVTAVPLGTPQNQEISQSRGTFFPTVCSSTNVGAIEIKYNFPRQINFIWTAPRPAESGPLGIYDSLPAKTQQCLEIRATIVPWHWHRMYFRNTGGLTHTLCLARDLREIDHWPNYVGVYDRSNRSERKSDSVRVRSIQSDGGVDDMVERDRYSDSAFYGTDESGTCSVQELPKPVRRCCACNTAVYRLVIQSDWQQQQHWRDWPAGELTSDGKTVSPHWSEILGASHSPLYDVFHAGGFASPAVDALCTTSDVSKLENEFRNQAGENILTVIRTRGIDSAAPPKQRIRSALFAVNNTHHLISFLTRLVPSTDWCTGLSRVDLCLPNCSWPLRLQYKLEPWDAGVMSGNTYVPVEPSERLREPKPMCPITPDLRPNTPFTVQTDYIPLPSMARSNGVASEFTDLSMDDPTNMNPGKNSFHLPRKILSFNKPRRILHTQATTRLRRTFARLGTVELELLRINEHEACSSEQAQEDQAFGQASAGATTTTSVTTPSANSEDCHLGKWTPWGPCTMVDASTCDTAQAKMYWSSKAPKTQRTRVILPSSNIMTCSELPLKEEKTCHTVTVKERCPVNIPMNSIYNSPTMPPEACQSFPWGHWSQCLNATCSRPGIVYRWRRFPDKRSRQWCEQYPDVSQVDTCWPPPNVPCRANELKEACSEAPPVASKLCSNSQNLTTRYFFTSQEQRCEKFMYSPECHLRALMQYHELGRSRNVFHTHEVCEKVCKTNADQSLKQSRYLVKRNLDQCLDSLDVGHSCKLSRAVSKWYFDESANECIEFQYLGCGGNANRFNEREDCEEKCKVTFVHNKPNYGRTMNPSRACQFTAWSEWSTCSQTCGTGRRTRSRLRLKTEAPQCHSLNAEMVQEELCHLPKCATS